MEEKAPQAGGPTGGGALFGVAAGKDIARVIVEIDPLFPLHTIFGNTLMPAAVCQEKELLHTALAILERMKEVNLLASQKEAAPRAGCWLSPKNIKGDKCLPSGNALAVEWKRASHQEFGRDDCEVVVGTARKRTSRIAPLYPFSPARHRPSIPHRWGRHPLSNAWGPAGVFIARRFVDMTWRPTKLSGPWRAQGLALSRWRSG